MGVKESDAGIAEEQGRVFTSTWEEEAEGTEKTEEEAKYI